MEVWSCHKLVLVTIIVVICVGQCDGAILQELWKSVLKFMPESLRNIFEGRGAFESQRIQHEKVEAAFQDEVRLGLGIPDTEALVGRLFHHCIPKKAFEGKISEIKVSESGSTALPSWMYLNETSGCFEGVPLSIDQGLNYIQVTAIGEKQQVNTHFLINVHATHQLSNKALDIKFCDLTEAEFSSSLLLGVPLPTLSAKKRVSLIQDFAKFLDRKQIQIQLVPKKSSSILKLLDSKIVFSHPKDAESKDPQSELIWSVACKALENVESFHKIILKNVQTGALNQTVVYPIIGWYLTEHPPVLKARHRRQLGLITPTPTVGPTVPSSAVSYSTHKIVPTKVQSSVKKTSSQPTSPVISTETSVRSVPPSTIQLNLSVSHSFQFTPSLSDPVVTQTSDILAPSISLWSDEIPSISTTQMSSGTPVLESTPFLPSTDLIVSSIPSMMNVSVFPSSVNQTSVTLTSFEVTSTSSLDLRVSSLSLSSAFSPSINITPIASVLPSWMLSTSITNTTSVASPSSTLSTNIINMTSVILSSTSPEVSSVMIPTTVIKSNLTTTASILMTSSDAISPTIQPSLSVSLTAVSLPTQSMNVSELQTSSTLQSTPFWPSDSVSTVFSSMNITQTPPLSSAVLSSSEAMPSSVVTLSSPVAQLSTSQASIPPSSMSSASLVATPTLSERTNLLTKVSSTSLGTATVPISASQITVATSLPSFGTSSLEVSSLQPSYSVGSSIDPTTSVTTRSLEPSFSFVISTDPTSLQPSFSIASSIVPTSSVAKSSLQPSFSVPTSIGPTRSIVTSNFSVASSIGPTSSVMLSSFQPIFSVLTSIGPTSLEATSSLQPTFSMASSVGPTSSMVEYSSSVTSSIGPTSSVVLSSFQTSFSVLTSIGPTSLVATSDLKISVPIASSLGPSTSVLESSFSVSSSIGPTSSFATSSLQTSFSMASSIAPTSSVGKSSLQPSSSAPTLIAPSTSVEVSSMQPSSSVPLSIEPSSSVASSSMQPSFSVPPSINPTSLVASSSLQSSFSIPVSIDPSVSSSSVQPTVAPSIGPTSSISFTTSAIVTTEPPGPVNTPPVVKNIVPNVKAKLGRFYDMTIPENTFHDAQDGGTRNLKLSLLNLTLSPLDWWLHFNSSLQTLHGLPLQSDLGTTTVFLLATDSGGLSTGLTVQVSVTGDTQPDTHAFTLNLEGDFEKFITDQQNIVRLVHRIGAFFGDERGASIQVVNVEQGSVIMSWSNHTLSTQQCDNSTIQETFTQLSSKAFKDTLSPEFVLQNVSLQLYGVCLANGTIVPIAPSTGPNLAAILIPILVILLLFLVILLVYCLCTKYLFSGSSILEDEKPMFAKGHRPMLLESELEMKDPYNKPKRPVRLDLDERDFDETSFRSGGFDNMGFQAEPQPRIAPPDYYSSVQGANAMPPQYKLPPPYMDRDQSYA